METNGYLFRVLSDLVLAFFKILAESNLIDLTFEATEPRTDKDLLITKVLEIINSAIKDFLQAIEQLISNKSLKNMSTQVYENLLVQELAEAFQWADISVVRGIANGKVLVENFCDELKGKIDMALEELKVVKMKNEEIKVRIAEEVGKIRNLNTEIKRYLA